MDLTIWQEALFESLTQSSEDGHAAVAFLRARKTKISFRRARPDVGAFWTVMGNICLNARTYSYKNSLDDPYLQSLIIHEARHLQQGMISALSVYGELEAWQMQFHFYQKISGKQPSPAIVELLSLPLSWDRRILRRAQDLMRTHAGKGYRADRLPLYPLRKEILFWLGRWPVNKTSHQQ
jgi:hypothetical protein